MSETTELSVPSVADAPTAAQVDRLLREFRVDAAAARQAHAAWRRVPRLFSGLAAGWHHFDDIPTLVGLEGDFFWTEDWMRPARIAFRFDAGMEGVDGKYTISTLTDIVEQGVFHCVPNNPAMGWAAVGLMPDSGAEYRFFTVAGMMTDSQWRISVLLLNKLAASGPVNPPFSALRLL